MGTLHYGLYLHLKMFQYLSTFQNNPSFVVSHLPCDMCPANGHPPPRNGPVLWMTGEVLQWLVPIPPCCGNQSTPASAAGNIWEPCAVHFWKCHANDHISTSSYHVKSQFLMGKSTINDDFQWLCQITRGYNRICLNGFEWTPPTSMVSCISARIWRRSPDPHTRLTGKNRLLVSTLW